jgi:hypothetical protein
MAVSIRRRVSARAVSLSGVPGAGPWEGDHLAALFLGGLHGLQPDLRPAFAQTAARFVEGDLGQPGQQAGFGAEAADRREGAHIGFLQHILRLGVVLDHAAGDAEQALVVALHHRPERAVVAPRGSRREVAFGQGLVVDGEHFPGAAHHMSSWTTILIGCGGGPEVPVFVVRCLGG